MATEGSVALSTVNPSELPQDSTHRFTTDARNTKLDALPVNTDLQTALTAKAPLSSPAFTGTPTGITKSHVGLPNVDNTSDAGKPISTAQAAVNAAKADLVGGTVPSNQLPSYVDDVLEYANQAAFPGTGVSGTIYVAQDSNLTYRWGGSSYILVSGPTTDASMLTSGTLPDARLSSAIVRTSDLATIASSGSYNDLIDQPLTQELDLSVYATKAGLETISNKTIQTSVAESPGIGGSAISNNTAALKVKPLNNRDNVVGHYLAGIAFPHLYGHNGASTYNNLLHAWIGTKLVSTTGSELAAVVIAVKVGTLDTDVPVEKMAIGQSGVSFADPITAPLYINTQTASYTLIPSDANGLVRQNVATANTVTIPTNATAAFPIGTQITISNSGAGQVTVNPASGTTLQSAGSANKLRVQHSTGTIVKVATDTWLLTGDITS